MNDSKIYVQIEPSAYELFKRMSRRFHTGSGIYLKSRIMASIESDQISVYKERMLSWPDEKQTQRIAINIDMESKQAFVDLCCRYIATPSDIIRRWVYECLDKNKLIYEIAVNEDDTNDVKVEPVKAELTRCFPVSGQIWRHFKGKEYRIITISKHSETNEQYVVYSQLYAPYEDYVRPLDMFMSEVDHTLYPEAAQRYRFELIDK